MASSSSGEAHSKLGIHFGTRLRFLAISGVVQRKNSRDETRSNSKADWSAGRIIVEMVGTTSAIYKI